MQTKKHPNANLENYSKLFVQLGLVLALTIVYVLIQNKTYEKDIAMLVDSGQTDMDMVEANVLYELEKPKPKPKQKKPDLSAIEEAPDDEEVEDIGFEDVDPEAPIEASDIEDYEEPEEFDPNDEVIFIMLEDAPVFPGCKGSKEEMKMCFSKKISKFINRKFNADLASELGLSPGKKRIHTVFKIDKNGKIIDIQARAPHIRLQKEAIRVINLLPQMEPGKQRGNPVTVKYNLPIVFSVE